MKPGCCVTHITGIVKFVGELFARTKAAIQIKQFHQVDNRLSPIEFLLRLPGKFIHDGLDVDLRVLWIASAGPAGDGGYSVIVARLAFSASIVGFNTTEAPGSASTLSNNWFSIGISVPTIPAAILR